MNREKRFSLFVSLSLSFATLITGCGGGSSAPPPPPGPVGTITSVSVTSPQSYIEVGQQRILTATVLGTGHFVTTVTWTVNGILSGDAANGTITLTGDYIAPATLPPINPVTITATSIQDKTKSASITLDVFAISISPPNALVAYGHTQQFTATLTGPVTNYTFVWNSQFGTIDANGLYTAPQFNGAVTDLVLVGIGNSPNVSARVTLQYPPPILNSITPNGASANEPVTIDGQDLYGVLSISFPGPFGSLLPAAISSQPSLNQINTTVPLGAVNGQVTVQFNPTGTITTASVPFIRLPNLRIRAGVRDLSSGETVQFQSRLLGGTSPNTVNWTADVGNVNTTGLYQAPTVSQESIATITACLVGTRSCDSTMLRIIPLRITPAMPVVSMGQNLQLDAIQGSLTSANWAVLAGGGNVNSSGLFTAPTNPTQAGGVPLSATVGSANGVASVAVTGAFPGLIGRTYDYMNFGYDPLQQQFLQRLEGTFVRNLAVSGSRAFALDLGLRASPPFDVNPPFTALEVYDISSTINPVWLGATESVSNNPILFSVYGRYGFEVDASRIALYDVQSSPPQLLSLTNTPDLGSAFDDNGLIYATPFNGSSGPTTPTYIFDVTNGTVQQTQIDLTPPAAAQLNLPPFAVIGTANLMYALFGTPAGGAEVAAYDLTVSPPTLLGSTPLNGQLLSGFNVLIRGNLLFMGNVIFDISNPVPVQVGTAPVQYISDVKGTRLLGRGFLPLYTAPDNYLLVDITNPANPVIRESVYDLPDGIVPAGKFVGTGNSILASEGLGGIATIDLSRPAGGLIDKARVGVFPDGFIFDHQITQQTMFVAGASALGSGGLVTFDLSTGTPIFLGIQLYGQNEAFAVQIANNKAFLGLLDSLKTIDITNPANLFETGSLALPTSALALSGNTLFDGTLDGRLVAIDATNPNNLSILGAVALPAPAINLRLAGSTLFVADGSSGLLIFDVSNPAAPMFLSQLSLSTPVWDVSPSGGLAFLAADSSGLVVADISNLRQPKQISQTTLESYNLFPAFFDEGPRSVALSIALQNGLVYLGTANSVGLVFAFDYSQPTYPRLVSMNAFGEFIDTLVSGFSFSGNDIYAFGALGVQNDIVQSDNSAPRNTIDLYDSPLGLRSITFFAAQVPSGRVKAFVHPKFDGQLFRRKHQQLRTRDKETGFGLGREPQPVRNPLKGDSPRS